MGALLADHAVPDDQDAVGVADGREAMGDNQGGAPLGQLVKGPLDLGLRHAVQGGGGLVQNQHRRVLEENPGDGNALFLPAGEEGPPLAHVGLEAVGHGHDIVIDLRPLGRGDHLVHRGAGTAVADVLQNAVGEEEHVLLHHADAPAEALLLHVPHIGAVQPDAARARVVEPGDEAAQGGLSAAGGPYHGDGLAGVHMEGYVVEDLRVVPLVGEGDVLHINAALDVFQLHGVRLIGEVRLQAHQLHKPGQAGDAVHQHFGQVGQLAQGVDEGAGIEAEGDEVGVVHLPLHDEPAAHGDDHHRHNAGEELHGTHEPAHRPVALLLGGLEPLVGAEELPLFRVLVGEGLGGAHAGDAGLDIRVDSRHVGLHVLGGPHHAHAVQVDHNDKYRDQNQHHQGQPPLDSKHNDHSAHQGDAGDEHVLRPVVGQLRDVEKFRRHPAHKVSGAVFVIKAEGKGLQMGEQVLPDVRLHQHAEGVAPVAHHVLQARPQQIGRPHDGHHGEKRLIPALGNQLVQAYAGHEGKQQVHTGNHQRTGHIQKEKPHMRSEIAEKDAQKALVAEVAGTHEGSSVFYFIIASYCSISGFQMQRGQSLIFSPAGKTTAAQKTVFSTI